ncbi:MCE family protein [Actinokineospora bangkokensis]|uniref:ABC transporter substrate-binding protein n=1 Tax=Actinokineospora bangkokensis TaxID=1193682 RepID=A0A1Q9LF53_9PSEU|nr:MCE family protein [Actinokineospora bangkokensis]OLR90653.1 ABC transporter substrate-binding protein [Actinokineospora bangkokensis]
MLTKTVRLQLVAFVVIAVVAVVYALFRFTDIGRVFGANGYRVTLQLVDSGGIFTNAEVTYRGVNVGRVGEIHLTRQGMDVDLNIDPEAPAIPADLDAVVANRSAVGEQFVDLRPRHDGGAVLQEGTVIPADRAKTPVSTDTVLRDLDALATSVPTDSLRTVVDELDRAFTGTGPDLQVLLDTASEFTQAAKDNLPQTIKLIQDGQVVLDTQAANSGDITSFADSLAQVTAQLKASDPQLRTLIATTPAAAQAVTDLLRESGQGLGVVTANLLTTANIFSTRNNGIELALVVYPALAAGTKSVVPGDGTAHLGLALNLFDPPPCTKGYEGTERRAGDELTPIPENDKAYCAEPLGSPINVRGAQNAPFGGTPEVPTQGDIDANRDRSAEQLAAMAALQGQAAPQAAGNPLTSIAGLLGIG